jgi:hypothetical protein
MYDALMKYGIDFTEQGKDGKLHPDKTMQSVGPFKYYHAEQKIIQESLILSSDETMKFVGPHSNIIAPNKN